MVVFVLLWGFKDLWIFEIQNRWSSKVPFVTLAIDVPDLVEPNLKAVEQIFHQVSGIFKTPNLIEVYWEGWNQESVSFEIASNGGNVQFFIHTPAYYRDLIESAIYAQYPLAEITLVEDYLKDIPTWYPDEKFDFWGTQFVAAKENAYPLRTHLNFEYGLSQKFADPMAAILEIFNRLQPGEHAWYQITIKPTKDDSWKTKSDLLVKKLVGSKAKAQETLTDKIIQFPVNLVNFILDLFLPGTPFADKKVESTLPSLMQHLTPGEQEVVTAIGKKSEKQGFITKIRLIYFAEKSVFSKATRIGALVGAIKQFNTQNLNALKPDGKATTRANYFFVKRRIARKQRKLIRALKGRSTWVGAGELVLNSEELATLWHFPTEEVKTPLVKRTVSKKIVPPQGLPESTGASVPIFRKEPPSANDHGVSPPTNLPVV